MTSGPGELHATVEERLRAVGQRYTANRRALVDALVRARGPVSIGDLLVGRRALPQSSAYRNLAVLEQAGVIRRVITDDDFHVPTTVARFGNVLATVNAHFDTGFPPPPQPFEVVVVRR